MQNLSQYVDARVGAIQAATDLYGECSEEVAIVRNAWAAVDVGNPNSSNDHCVNIVGPSYICSDFALAYPHTFEAISRYGGSVTWNVPSIWSYTTSGIGDKLLHIHDAPIPNGAGNFNITASFNWANYPTVSDTKSVYVYNCGFGGSLATTDNSSENNSISELSEVVISLAPNPVINRLKLTSNQELIGGTIEIFDAQGKMVETHIWEDYEPEIKTQSLANGLYFIKITKNTFSIVHKFIKQ